MSRTRGQQRDTWWRHASTAGGGPASHHARRYAPSRQRNVFLDMPFGWRLALGFILAALIAAAATGASYVQRAQALANEASFYEHLLASNTTLTTTSNLLQLTDTKIHLTLADTSVAKPSHETLANDQSALEGLLTRSDTSLADYVATHPLDMHPDEVALLALAGHAGQATQQRTLINSVVRSWQVFRAAVNQAASAIAGGDQVSAAATLRAQEEPTFTDALSAVRSLIQFNGRVATSVRSAADVEQGNQLITVIAAASLAVVAIALVGWLLSESVVRRLMRLRRVLAAVDDGDISARVVVRGHDEIGRVSASVNRMLDTIMGLLDVTRRQRDTMLEAAERLFADVRVAGAGDLQARGTVSGDPIGMLASAFNFTVGRFRRFVGRTQSTVDQLDLIARQQYERAEAFLLNVRLSNSTINAASLPSFGQASYDQGQSLPAPLVPQEVHRARELVRLIAREGAGSHARTAFDAAEQAYLSAGRLSQLALSLDTQRKDAYSAHLVSAQIEELRTLGGLLTRVGHATQAVQQHSAMRLTELDSALDRISTVKLGGATDPALPPGAARPDISRAALVYAQDIATQAREVMSLMQDMRANLATFRLEGGAPQGTMLYTPGATGNEPGLSQGAEWLDQLGQQHRGASA
ncbi:MAG TPA: methyl-accepting chemotaxis protein [Ktedonobacterales bacterium]